MLIRWPVHERVLANLIDGSAIDGLLIRRSGPLLVLADAVLYTPGNESAVLDGHIYIERARVLYLQTTTAKQLQNIEAMLRPATA